MNATLAALEAAIAELAGLNAGPGYWTTDVTDEAVLLVYREDIEPPRWVDGDLVYPERVEYTDDPWKVWGGDQIIAAAGVGAAVESGIAVYRSKYAATHDDTRDDWVAFAAQASA